MFHNLILFLFLETNVASSNASRVTVEPAQFRPGACGTGFWNVQTARYESFTTLIIYSMFLTLIFRTDRPLSLHISPYLEGLNVTVKKESLNISLRNQV